ncbi:hypothetical protein [Natrinema soli]|uniref:Uncharacterized protein n=1 Tax=Natrinema soli TaxID=1930624 RepID=A0ABD5SUA3_9EURY|nr:hypothetical protein [Natrinema soli]
MTAEDERLVEPSATAAIPGIASPGESRTITVSVDGATATEPFAFDVEATPGTKDGDVDITYTADGAVEIAFAPFEVPPSDGGHAAVDEPPCEITVPSCGPDGSRDPLWLCENMPAEPTLEFEQKATSSVILRDEGLAFQTDGPGSQFYATFLTEAGDLERVDRNASGPTAELIESTAFESAAILVVQTGWGSGTITPYLERLEPTDDGIHAFGCYRRPCAGTDDYTVRTVVARFERPDTLETGSVSLTVDTETRMRFEVGDGVVSLPDGR